MGECDGVSVTFFCDDSSDVIGYIEAVRRLACEITELIAEGLWVSDTSVFTRLIRDVDNDSIFRLNHYPPICTQSRDTSPSHNITTIGFGEHTDPQILTLLRSNDVGGLQISLEPGVWVPVPPDPTAFWVNVGDVLQVGPTLSLSPCYFSHLLSSLPLCVMVIIITNTKRWVGLIGTDRNVNWIITAALIDSKTMGPANEFPTNQSTFSVVGILGIQRLAIALASLCVRLLRESKWNWHVLLVSWGQQYHICGIVEHGVYRIK